MNLSLEEFRQKLNQNASKFLKYDVAKALPMIPSFSGNHEISVYKKINFDKIQDPNLLLTSFWNTLSLPISNEIPEYLELTEEKYDIKNQFPNAFYFYKLFYIDKITPFHEKIHPQTPIYDRYKYFYQLIKNDTNFFIKVDNISNYKWNTEESTINNVCYLWTMLCLQAHPESVKYLKMIFNIYKLLFLWGMPVFSSQSKINFNFNWITTSTEKAQYILKFTWEDDALSTIKKFYPNFKLKEKEKKHGSDALDKILVKTYSHIKKNGIFISIKK